MRQECRGSAQFRWLLSAREQGRHRGALRLCQNIEETKTFHRDFVDDKMETATMLLREVININSFASSVSVRNQAMVYNTSLCCPVRTRALLYGVTVLIQIKVKKHNLIYKTCCKINLKLNVCISNLD